MEDDNNSKISSDCYQLGGLAVLLIDCRGTADEWEVLLSGIDSLIAIRKKWHLHTGELILFTSIIRVTENKGVQAYRLNSGKFARHISVTIHELSNKRTK